jgi:hypothetical protein
MLSFRSNISPNRARPVSKPHDQPPLGEARPHVFGDLMREIGPAIDPHSDKIYSASDRRKYWTQNVFRFRAVWVAKWAFGMLGEDGKT